MEREIRGKRKRPVRLTSDQMEWFVSVKDKYSVSLIQEDLKNRYGIALSKKEIYTRKSYYTSKVREAKEIVCKYCNVTFTVRAYQDRRTTYCSKQCETRYWKRPRKKKSE